MAVFRDLRVRNRIRPDSPQRTSAPFRFQSRRCPASHFRARLGKVQPTGWNSHIRRSSRSLRRADTLRCFPVARGVLLSQSPERGVRGQSSGIGVPSARGGTQRKRGRSGFRFPDQSACHRRRPDSPGTGTIGRRRSPFRKRRQGPSPCRSSPDRK